MKILKLLLITVVICSLGCYTFSGISIPPEVKTFYVETFVHQANNAPINITQQFCEALRNKIRQQTSLVQTDVDPDVEFKGAITGFRVTSEAPQPGELTAFNRLTIYYSVEYIDNTNPKNNWKSSFNFPAEYASGENLLDVQDELINNIHDQLLEDIYNKAFTNW